MCTCYLLTQRETLMPADVVGVTETGLIELSSPQGKTYTCNPGNIVNVDDAAVMLRQGRAAKLIAQGYCIMHLRGDRYRVWSPVRHGETGGYIVTLGEVPTCSCPDHADHGFECKHILGAPDLLRYAQVEKPTVRVAAKVRNYTAMKVGEVRIELSADELERRVNAKLAARRAAA